MIAQEGKSASVFNEIVKAALTQSDTIRIMLIHNHQAQLQLGELHLTIGEQNRFIIIKVPDAL